MTGDLIDRLRSKATDCHQSEEALYLEAADTIQRLSERVGDGVDYKALAIELSDALLTVRPLGGSELFIKRGGRFFADPAYMKLQIERDRDNLHSWIKEAVRAKKDCAKAEARLAEAVKLIDAGDEIYAAFNHVAPAELTRGQFQAMFEYAEASNVFRAPVSGSSNGGQDD